MTFYHYSEDDEDDEFERQESSDEEDEEDENEDDNDSDDSGETDGVSSKAVKDAEENKRSYENENKNGIKKPALGEFTVAPEVTARMQSLLDTDDLSSDDEEAEGNTIGRVPLHW